MIDFIFFILPRNLLACPRCHASLSEENGSLHCTSCASSFLLKGSMPVFVRDFQQEAVTSHQQPKSILRRLGKMLVPPHHSVYFDSLRGSHGEGAELYAFLREHPDATVLNIGSLSMNLSGLHPNIINLDISEYPNLDVVGDAHCLPFKDASMDIILLKNVIEHIRDPATVINEIHRVLKPGGFLYAKIPFLQPFHAVPDHYQGYTVNGIKELLKDFTEVRSGISVGPGSMLSWILREYLAVLTSFGNMRLYNFGLIFWGWLTFWVKYTDVFFRGNRLANRVTSAFWGIYQK